MFKSLLRTIPLLSGNIKINCYVDNFEQNKKDKDKFYAFIKHADLSPLQNSLLNQRIKLSLLDGSWEYDISKYYHYYNSAFYNKNYSFNKSDYQILDLFSSNQISSRNKDYEFGCKRVSYSQTGYQFNFFAPIWCDNFDSLPDYFRIAITFSNGINKYIYIPIKEYYDENYLRNYLKKYLNKIDSNVIFGNQTDNQGVYYGIDVKRGGFVSIIDNVFTRIYNMQMTQNNFDNTICEGFARNNLVIRQVLPLSFSFNIEDIMTKQEKFYFMNEHVKISGSYIKSNLTLRFYDFNTNYYSYKFKYKTFDKQLKEFVFDKSSNVCESSYPALQEKRYIGYKYSNKLTPIYNRWKLKCTPDDYPYITNINYAFNKENSHIYGDYPIFLNYAKITNDNFDGNNFNIDYDDDEYINILNNNISTWFSLYNKNIFFRKNEWSNIINNKTYYNGILYDFNNLFNDIDTDLSFDKFGVFIEPTLNMYNDSLKKIAKNILSDSFSEKYNICINKTIKGIYDGNDNYITVPLYQLNNDKYNCYIDNDSIIYNNDDYDGYETYIEYDKYLDNNRYYDYKEIYDDLPDIQDIQKILNNKIIEGYYKLPLNYVENIYAVTSGINDTNNELVFIFRDFATNSKVKLYYSIDNSTKIPLTKNNAISIFNDDFYEKYHNNEIAFYIIKSFITEYDIYNAYEELYTSNKAHEILNKLYKDVLISAKTFNYIHKDTLNNFAVYEYFEDELFNCKSSLNRNKDNCIWISSYNLSNLPGIKDEMDNLISKEFYAKFLNIDNIKEYISYISANNDNVNICDYIYLRQRLTTYNDKTYCFDFYDTYTQLSKIVNYNNIYDLLDEISYNDKKQCFKLHYNKKYTFKQNVEIEDKNIDNSIDVDLYFYETFYVLNDKIYNFMRNNDYEMYLYKLNNDTSTIYDNIIYTYSKSDGYGTWYDLKVNKDNLYDIYSSSLYPLFYSVYTSEKDKSFINDMFGEISEENNTINTIYIKQYNYNCFDDTKNEYVAYRYIYGSMQNLFMTLNIAYNLGFAPKCFNEKMTFDYIKNVLLEPLNNDIYDVNNNELYNTSLTNYNLDELLSDYFNNLNKYTENELLELENEIIECTRNILLNYPEKYEDVNLRKRFFELNIDELVDESNNKILYKSRKNIEIRFINDSYDNPVNNLYNTYKLNMYTQNNVNYLYYRINVIYDNTSYSFNIIDKNNILQNIISIDNEEIQSYNINGKNYNKFYKIYPYLKTNIFLNYFLTSKNIIKPNSYNINLYYYPVIIDNGSSNKSYLYSGIFYDENETDKNVFNIYYDKNINKVLNLNRYINDIEPLIEEINEDGVLNNVFELKYKTSLSTFNENNIFNYSLNIYKYGGIRLYKNLDNMSEYNIIDEYEYKHFNDNKMYNLEKEILIKFDETFTYEELLELQLEKNILLHFGKYLNKSDFYIFNDNQILFLYNRYKLNILSNSVKLNKQKSKKLYTLAYKFTLY